MATKEKKVDIYKRFETIRDFIRYIDTNKTTPVFEGHENSKDGGSRFSGTSSLDAATDLILYGDKNLAKKLNDAGLEKERTKIFKTREHRQLVSSVVGAVPNVPAYIAGSPNSMVTYRNKRVKQRVVNVAYNCAVFGGYSADSIVAASVKLLIALMKIEAGGTNVNLYAVNLDTTKHGTVSYSIRVKTAGQKFDVLKMAYPIAHPSMNRRHKFRFTEVTEGVPSSFLHGYGCPEDNDDTIRKHFARHGLKLDRAFNYESLAYMGVEDIIKAILTGE